MNIMQVINNESENKQLMVHNNNLDNQIEILINDIKISMPASVLYNKCGFIERTLENISKNEHYEFFFKINIDDVKLFFHLLIDTTQDAITLANMSSLYKLANFFEASTILNLIFEFIIKNYNSTTCKFFNEFLLNSADSIICSKNKKILKLYIRNLFFKLSLKQLLIISKTLNSTLDIFVNLYAYYDELKCKYSVESNIINAPKDYKRFINGDKLCISKLQLEEQLYKYTYGLLDFLPWHLITTSNGFVFSGGLLYDLITNLQEYNYTGSVMTTMHDIDIFFYGNGDEYEKQRMVYKLVKNLLKKYEKVYISIIEKSIIEISIDGIPRTIQLIFSNSANAQNCIRDFDCTHVQMYYTKSNVGTIIHNIYCSINCLSTLITQNTKTITYSSMLRNFKALNRGLSVININTLFVPLIDTLDYNEIINSADVKAYMDNSIDKYHNKTVLKYQILKNKIDEKSTDTQLILLDFKKKLLHDGEIKYSNNFLISYSNTIHNIDSIEEKIHMIANEIMNGTSRYNQLNNPGLYGILKNVQILHYATAQQFGNVLYYSYDPEENKTTHNLLTNINNFVMKENAQRERLHIGYSSLKYNQMFQKHLILKVKDTPDYKIYDYMNLNPNQIIVESHKHENYNTTLDVTKRYNIYFNIMIWGEYNNPISLSLKPAHFKKI